MEVVAAPKDYTWVAVDIVGVALLEVTAAPKDYTWVAVDIVVMKVYLSLVA